MACPANANAADTKQRIIEAASELFAHKGRDGTSVREIAESAHVNSAMISHYFGGKDGLYQDCIRCLYEAMGTGQAALEVALVNGEDIPEVLESTMHHAINFAREKRDMIRLVMRHVLDRGELDPKRRDSVLLPFLDKASQAIAPVSMLSESDIRMGLQSLIFLTVRYALSTDDELKQITGDNTQFLVKIGDHLATTSQHVLGLRGDVK
ncbi:MAG: TetR family transcriptional regulator [Myxococcota bacterium]|nr:TetR family transcriptional regulator [Myxococcota bacterium]